MNKYLFLLLFGAFVLTACADSSSNESTTDTTTESTESGEEATTDTPPATAVPKAPADASLDKIDGYPEGMVGCVCSFAENEEDLAKEKFIYFEKYNHAIESDNIKVISINGELITIDPTKPNESAYKIAIAYAPDAEEAEEGKPQKKVGTLVITTNSGGVIRKNFVGACGC